MFRRKSASQTNQLLEYLTSAEQERQKASESCIAQTAAVDEKNANLDTKRHKLENLLKSALARDSFIDLDSLKMRPRISAFDRKIPERRSYLPKPPSGFGSLMPWKKKAYERQFEAAEAKYREDRHEFMEALHEHQRKVDREQAEVDAHNVEIERYKQEFSAGKPTAIAEYFELVLEKSAYPAGFPRETKVAYAAESETLHIDLALPALNVIPEAKSYAYDSIRDEISETNMPQKQRARLYALVLAQISLRTVHEIFTADRSNKTACIAFDGYVDGINPSTGRPGRFCLVALKITRQQFDSLDLRQVEPRACLQGLNARISSRPDQLFAVPPMIVDDPQDATVADGTDNLYLKQQISEREGAINAQSALIAELKSKLAARRDKNGELSSVLRDKQAVIDELESRLEAQRDRIAELVPELREEQERNAALQVEIQGQKDYIAELESRLEAQNNDIAELEAKLTEALDDTQPAEAITEFSAGDEFSEAGMFAPIVGETEDDGSGGARIPRRAEEAQANIHLAPHPKLLEIMSIIVQACQHGQYFDSRQAAHSAYHVALLFKEGILERSALNSNMLRPSPAGVKWYRRFRKLHEPPNQDLAENLREADSIPRREPEHEVSIDLSKSNLLETMSVFIEAQGKFVDYIGAGLPKKQINRLVREGRLERHSFHTDRLRATLVGNKWYRERSKQQGLPKRATEENLADDVQVGEKITTLRSLLLGDADDQMAESTVRDEPASGLADKDSRSGLVTSRPVPSDLAERETLIGIIGSPQSDSARLLALMVESGWRSKEDVLQVAFPDEFVKVIVEEINERAHDNIGENFIFEEEGQWIGHEDYCQDIEYIFSLPEYLHLRDSQKLDG